MASFIRKFSPEGFMAFNDDLPLFTEMHGGAFIVFISPRLADNDGSCWTPVRFAPKTRSNYLCAFCDIVQPNSCEHVQTFHHLKMHGGAA